MKRDDEAEDAAEGYSQLVSTSTRVTSDMYIGNKGFSTVTEIVKAAYLDGYKQAVADKAQDIQPAADRLSASQALHKIKLLAEAHPLASRDFKDVIWQHAVDGLTDVTPQDLIKVSGLCPSCHNATLFRGSSGRIGCSLRDCKDPGAAQQAIYNAEQRDRRKKQFHELTFSELTEANLSRVKRWHSLESWSPLEWAGAMCGEAGEAANFAKKLKRVSTSIQNHDKREPMELARTELVTKYSTGVGMEVADAVIYGVLLCASVDIDLVACIRKAFNDKSEEYGFPERL